MKRLMLLLAALPLTAAWVELRPPTGPVVVLTDAGDEAGRAALNHVEQYRHALGTILGQPELKSVWPVVVVVRKTVATPGFGLSRAGYVGTWKAGTAPGREWWKKLGAAFLEGSLPGRLPGDLEAALLDVYSTLEVQGLRVRVGAPVPAGERTATYSLLHMLVTTPELTGRARVLLTNLARGGEEDLAYRNAFEKPKAEIEAQAKAYAAAARYEAVPVSGRALDADRFKEIPASPTQVRLLDGDILLVAGGVAAVRAAYQKAVEGGSIAGGHEGLGLLAEMEKDEATALVEFTAAVNAEGAGPRAWVGFGRRVKDAVTAQQALEKASQMNPAWYEPHLRIAERSAEKNKRAFALGKAVAAAPRDLSLWLAWAQALEANGQWADASKAWRGAERATVSQAQRDELLEIQRKAEEQRLAQEAEERRKKLEAERAELDRLKNEALARIREAEDRANEKAGGVRGGEAVKWWDGEALEKVTGVMDRVECLGKTARVSLRDAAGKPVRLWIADPGKIAIAGAKEQTLACGFQKPPKKVVVEYKKRADARQGTAGDVATIEFQP